MHFLNNDSYRQDFYLRSLENSEEGTEKDNCCTKIFPASTMVNLRNMKDDISVYRNKREN